jgi:two-component system phosphate regulon sensor histidine kinase PhoR
MDYLQKFVSQVRSGLFLALLANNLLILFDWWLLHEVFHFGFWQIVISMIILSVLSLTVLPQISAKYITEPTKLIWQAILHIAPDAANVPAPDLKKRSLGHELVTYLTSHVYQLASVVDNLEQTKTNQIDLTREYVANTIPLPLMILSKDQTVMFANSAMCAYLERAAKDTIGQNVYSILDMSFNSAKTFDAWLADVKAKEAVSTNTWERVRIDVGEYRTRRQFDLAAYYNQSNPNGFETMLVFFDHSRRYAQDDQALSFVALAVHELRVPVTLLRGYIEALEEDLAGKMDPEMIDFMTKMRAASQSLSAFINNMLNVARIENNQLVLNLHEEQWGGIIQAAVNDINLRAKLQGVEVAVQLDDGLPNVGVDRVGIYEVLVNLIDNAIKYSGSGKQIIVKSYLTPDGMVETTIQDFGAGIPANVMTNLFEKYYRSHRSRSQVGGTGLGLYLSKSIVDAHGGKIWVRSQEGQGSTFGFTVQPYAKLADEQKTGDNKDITRGAHGWIKNHSLYSR